jgi:uncharacterized protein DUF882
VTRVLVALLVLTGAAHADQAKKDRERAGKSDKHADAPAPGTRPAKLVNLYNTWTHEWLAVDPAALPAQPIANRFLRDHYTNESRAMEPRLVQILVAAAQSFRSETVMIVSGFRHPKFNLLLRKKGHQVARDSHHSAGDAVDFYLPKITTEQLHAWAIAQKIGGVGLYLDSGFVHMDTGVVRTWSGE